MTTNLIPETSSAPSLREQARAIRERKDAEYEAKKAREAQAECERRSRTLSDELMKHLGVEPESVIIEGSDPQAHVDGLVFALRDLPYADSYRDRDQLHVQVECARACGLPLFVDVQSLYDLDAKLSTPQVHRHQCLVKYDDEGEPTTDGDGNPLPPRRPIAPRLSPEQQARHSIVLLHEAGERCANAFNTVALLEDDRALIKPEAIRRLMESGAATSVTAAERIVESDPEYAAHRATQRDAELDKWRAAAQWEAAKLTATLDVALVRGMARDA